MVDENSEYSILEYLQKNGATNTFKLAYVLEIKREKLLRILKNLEGQELVKIVRGKVEFLSYPSEKKVKKKPKVSKEKSEVQTLQEEVEKQKSYTEKLKAQVKKLEQRPPKVITKTIIKKAKPKVITRTIIKESEPIKTERKKKRKREKTPALPKFKPKKAKKIKKVKFKLKLPKLKIPKIRIKGALGLFGVKKFIKNLKGR